MSGPVELPDDIVDKPTTQHYALLCVMCIEFYPDFETFGYYKCDLEIEAPIGKKTVLSLKRADSEMRKLNGDPQDCGMYFIKEGDKINLLTDKPELFLLDMYNSILINEDFGEEHSQTAYFLEKNDYGMTVDDNHTYCMDSKLCKDNETYDIKTIGRQILLKFAMKSKSVRMMQRVRELKDYLDYLYEGIDVNLRNKMFENNEVAEILISTFHQDREFDVFWKEILERGNKKDIECFIVTTYFKWVAYSHELLRKIKSRYMSNFYKVMNYSTNNESVCALRLKRLNNYYDNLPVISDGVVPMITFFGFITYILKQKPSDVCSTVKDLMNKMCDFSTASGRQMGVVIMNILNTSVENTMALLLFTKNFESFLGIIQDKNDGYKNIYNIGVILETAYYAFRDRVKVPRGFICMIVRLETYAQRVIPRYKTLYDKEQLRRIDKIFDISFGVV